MAQLGVRRFDELIGRSDVLDAEKGIQHWKAKGLDFSKGSSAGPECRPMLRATTPSGRTTGSNGRSITG